MEGSKIPELLEDVLSGRPEDPQSFKTLVNQLHEVLGSSPSNLKQAQTYFQIFKNRIPEGNFKYFSDYLSSLSQGKSGPKPSLACLHLVNSSIFRASKLYKAMMSLEIKQTLLKYNGFATIIHSSKQQKSIDSADFGTLEAKRLQCARLIGNLKSALGINMQKTMTMWQERKKPDSQTPTVGLRGLKRKQTMNLYDKKEKLLKVVKAVLKASPIIEQTAFWRWKFTMQALQDKEKRFKHAVELSEYVLHIRLRREGLDMLKQNARPLWQIYKDKLWRVLRKSSIRWFYSHKLAYHHWSGSPDIEIIHEFEEEQTHITTTKIVKKAPQALRSGKKDLAASPKSSNPANPSKSNPQLYTKAILRSVFKYSHNRLEAFFKKWSLSTSVKSYEDKKRRVQRFIDILHTGLKKNTAKCLVMPAEPKSRETVLTNALLAICKNIIFVKSRLFNKWARCQTPLSARYEEFLLRCLAKIPKQSLQSYFSAWKKVPRNIDAPRMFGMIAVLHRIFANKGKRVFHPPYIVKDADEIMRRTIKKIRSIIHNLYDSAFTRWHYHKIACYTREKACVFYRACQLAANPIKNSFSRWREKVHSAETVKRTHATGKLTRVLDKAFRARFKMVLFKSYMKTKPKKLLFRVFNFYSKKYCDETRTSFYRWKALKDGGDSNALQIMKDSATFSVIRLWTKSIHYRIKRGFYAFMKDNRHIKQILIRAFAGSWKYKKYQAWDRLRVIGKAYHDKYKAFKMTTALKRAARKPQTAGFKQFVHATPIKTTVTSIFKLFLIRMQRALFSLKLNVNYKEITEVKTVTKGLRKNIKNEKLRSVRVAGRSFVEVLKHLPKRTLNNAVRRILSDEKKHMRNAIKAIMAGFVTKPKEVMTQWYKFIHACRAGDILDRVKAEKLKASLVHLAGRRIRDSYQRVTGDGNKVKGVLKSIVRSIEKKTKSYLTLWKSYIIHCKKGDLMDAVRSQKLKLLLSSLERRTMKDSCQRILGAGDKIKGSIKSIIRQIEKRTKESMRLWHIFTLDCRHGKLMNAVKSEKLRISLLKVPARTMRDAYQRVIGGGDKIKGAVRTLVRNIEKRSKVAYSMWKVYVNKCKEGALMDGIRSQKLKIALGNIIKRTLRDANQRIEGAGDKILGSLKNIVRQIEKKTKESLRIWKIFVVDCKNGKLMNAVKSEKLKSCLLKVPARTMKDALQRVVGGGDKIKGAVRTLVRNIEQRSKVAYNLWKVYIHKCKQGALLDGLRSQKLKISLSNLIKRTLRDSSQRVQGAGNKILGSIKSVIKQIEKKTKESLRLWKLFVVECKSGQLLNAVKSQKLKSCLNRVPARVMRDSFQRIVGGGDKIKGAVRTLFRNIERRSKVAYSMWKAYVAKCKQGALMDGIRAHRVKFALTSLIKRTLRDADQRIIGAGNVIKGAIKEIIRRIEKRPHFAFSKWKVYVEDVKTSKLMDAIKSQRLKAALSRVPLRTVKRSFQLILGDGNQVKGAVKAIVRQIEKKPKFVLNKWNKVIIEIKHGNLFDACRTQKLRATLNRVTVRVLRDSTQRIVGCGGKIKGAIRTLKHSIEKRPAEALKRWTKFVHDVQKGKMMGNLRAYQLNLVLNRIPLRTLRSTYARVQGNGNLLAGVFKNLENQIKNMPRLALTKWKNWLNDVKHGKILEAVKAEKLKNALRKIPNRVLKDAYQRVIGGGDKVAGAIRGIFRVYKNMMVKGFANWKEFLENLKKKKFLDAFKSEKLKMSMYRITLRTLRNTNDKIIGMGNAVNGALMKVFKTCEKMQSVAYLSWKNYVTLCKTKSIMDNVRSQKLKITLINMLKKTLKATVHKVIYDKVDAKKAISYIFFVIKQRPRVALTNWRFYLYSCKTKGILDNLTSQKLKIALTLIPKRTLRGAFNRILGDGDVVKGALKEMVAKMMNRPRGCFAKWKDFVHQCKTKGFMDNLRSERLKFVMAHLKNRTMKGAVSRILGGGSLAVGALKKLSSVYKNKPRSALQKWVKYRDMINKNEILDSLKSQKLLKSLSKIPTRTLRGAYERVIGNGDIIKGAIRRVLIAFKNLSKNAFDNWNKFRIGCQNKMFMDNIKSQKLKHLMFAIPRRVIKDAFQRVIGDGSKVKGALKTFFAKILKKPKFALDKWKTYMQECRSKHMLDAVRSHKLLSRLNRIPVRTLKDACQRVIGGGSKAVGALKTIFLAVDKKVRFALRDWKDFVIACKSKKMLDGIRSHKLQFVLSRIPKKALNEVFTRLVKSGSIAIRTMRRLGLVFIKGPEIAFKNWKAFVDKDKVVDVKKDFENKFKGMKIKGSIEKPARKVLRSAKSHADHDNSKLKLAMKNLASAVTKRNLDAIRLWNLNSVKRRIVDVKQGEKDLVVSENFGLRLREALNRMVRKGMRDAFRRIHPIKNRAADALGRFEQLVRQRPKLAIFKWVKYAEKVNANELLNSIKTLKLRLALESVVKRKLRNAYLIVSGDGDRVKGALKSIVAGINKKMKGSLENWKKFVVSCREKRMFDSMRSKELVSTMKGITARTLRDAAERILGGGDKIKGAIRRLLNGLSKIPKDSIAKWKKYVFNCKNKSMFDGMRSFKLKNVFEKLSRRTLKNTANRIIGDGDIIKAVLKGIIKKMIDLPKDALKKWRKYLEMVKNKQMFDGLRSQKLKFALQGIPKRTLRNLFERVLGDGSLVKGALRRIQLTLQKKTKIAYTFWVKYVDDIKKKRFFDNARSFNLKIVMTRIILRTERTSFFKVLGNREMIKSMIRRIMDKMTVIPKQSIEKWKKYVFYCKNKTMFDGMRSFQLKNVFEKLARRTLKNTANRIIGDGDIVKATLKGIIKKMIDLPKDALKKWRKYLEMVKNKQMFDGLRSQKLKFALQGIPKRTLRNLFERVLGDGSLVKGALRRIQLTLQKKTKIAYTFWVKYVDDIKKKRFFDSARSFNLKIVMTRIILRTERTSFFKVLGNREMIKSMIRRIIDKMTVIPKQSIEKWKKYVFYCKNKTMFDGMRSFQLKNVFEKLARRTLKNTANRIIGDGDIVKATLKGIIKKMIDLPKDALKKWRKYLEMVKNKQMFDGLRSQKLKISLSDIPKRTLRNLFERVLGDGSLVKGALRRIQLTLQKKTKIAYSFWVKYIDDIKKKRFFDNARSFNLKLAMSRITKRTERTAFFRVLGNRDRVRALLQSIVSAMMKIPRTSVDKWKKFVFLCKNKSMFDVMRSHRLQISIERILRRSLKSSTNRILEDGNVVKAVLKGIIRKMINLPKDSLRIWKDFVNDIKMNRILDNLRSQKLKNSLARIPIRSLRSVSERILGEGNLIKGAIRRISLAIQKKPKLAFEQWKKFIEGVHKKMFYDSARSVKLQICLQGIVRRTERDASLRIIGGGNKLKAVLQEVMGRLSRIPKIAIDQWKKYLQLLKSNRLLDNLRSEKLKSSMQNIPRRKLRDVLERLMGDGDKVKGALRRIISTLSKKTKEAYSIWQKFVIGCKEKSFFDALRSAKLKNSLSNIPVRSLKNIFNRVIGGGNVIEGKLTTIFAAIEKLPRIAFKRWLAYLQDLKDKKLFDMMRSAKLKAALVQIPRRTIAEVFKSINVLDQLKIFKNAIKEILKAFLARPRDAVDCWKNYVLACKEKRLFDMVRSQKLLNTLNRIPTRRTKDAYARVIGGGDKIKGKLNMIFNSISRMPHVAFIQWKKFIVMTKTKGLLDNMKSLKLKQSMEKMIRRTVRVTVEKLIGDGSQAAGALRRIFIQIQKRARNGFNEWKKFVDGVREKKFLDSKRALQLKLALERITKRSFNYAVQRVIGDGNVVAGALRRLGIQIQTNLKKAVAGWKGFVTWHRHLTTFRSYRSYRFNKLLAMVSTRALRTAADVVLSKGMVRKDPTSAIRRIFAQYKTMSRRSFVVWKDYIACVKHGEMMDRVTSVKLKMNLEKLSSSHVRGSFLRIIGGGNRAFGMLKALAIKCLQVPRDAVKSWKNYVNEVKMNKLLDSAKALKLKHSMFHLTLRTLKTITKRITVGNPDVKTAINLVIAKHKEGKKHLLEKWKKFVDDCKKQLLFDQVRTERLRKKLISLPFRIMKNALERMLGDGSAVKGALRRLIMNVEKTKMVKFNEWKTEVSRSRQTVMMKKLKAMKFVECITRISSKTMRFVSDRLSGKRTHANKALRKVMQCLKMKYFSVFIDWKSKLTKLAIREEKIARKFCVFSNGVSNRTMKSAFNVILGRSPIMNVMNRLIGNFTAMQKAAITVLWGRVEKLRTIRKVNSAYYVFRGLLSYEKKVKVLRFNYWKNLDAVRKAILMKRTTGKMMCCMSVSFEGAFWKWKYIMTKTGNAINPKHSIVIKRLSKVGTNYQTRLAQFAFFKFILYYKGLPFGQKLTLPQALAKILKPESDSNVPSPDKESRPISANSADLKTAENPAYASNPSGLSQEEISSMNQMGAFEILSLTINEIKLRKLAWALSATFTYSQQVGFYDGERSRLIEQITELRYEKHSLLEDNNTLRHHNDSLVTSLEKANEEFQSMSLHLDHLRLTAMIRLLSRMAEMNMHGAFISLKSS